MQISLCVKSDGANHFTINAALQKKIATYVDMHEHTNCL